MDIGGRKTLPYECHADLLTLLSTAPINVVLRSTDGQDPFRERRFALRSGDKVPIGRASKNASKPELIMAPANGFIDSPVISREHAILSLPEPSVRATVFTPLPGLSLVDLGSMHGTFVNGHKLEAKQPMPLKNGDLLQFGADVSRNDSKSHHTSPSLTQGHADKSTTGFYSARNYVFESTAPSGFPNGFSVPEGETSEDEDEVNAHVMDDNMAMTQPPRYGSQNNPVNIDDFEDAQPVAACEIIELDVDDTIVAGDVTELRGEPTAASQETEERTSSSPVRHQTPPSPDEELESRDQASNKHHQDIANADPSFNDSSDYDAESHYASSLSDAEQDDDSNDELLSSPGGPLYVSAPEEDDEEESDEEDVARPHKRRPKAARKNMWIDVEAEVDEDEDEDDEEDSEEDRLTQKDKEKRHRETNLFLNVEADDEDEESDEGGLEQGDQENTDVGRGLGMKALLNTAIGRQEHNNPPQSPFAPQPSAPIGVPQWSAPLTAQSPSQDGSFTTYTPGNHSMPRMMVPAMREADSAMPALEPYYQQFGGAFDEPFGPIRASDFHMYTTLPPRPSAPRPGPWTAPAHPAPDVTDYIPSYVQYGGPSNGEPAQQNTPDLAHLTYPWGSAVSAKPADVLDSKPTEVSVSKSTEVFASTFAEVNGVQTPPQAPSSEVSTPPQPRRTKVSIPEIVESPEQPPTPTSVAGSLKRKADVFEKDAEELTLEHPTEVSAVAPVAMSTLTPASVMSERPKKKLRTRLGNAAKIVLNTTLGAAVAVALMSQVPDAFFQP
jgi:hypothetical protein